MSASAYSDDLAAIHAAGFTGIARYAARELIGCLPEPSRVLDLGCGDGTAAMLLAEAGHDVTGIDISPAMVALARERVPTARFEIGSAATATFPEGLDAILASGEVLGYAFDPELAAGTGLDRVIDRAAGALRRGGLFLFDLAGPDRAGSTPARTWAGGEGWTVLAEATADATLLTRRIVSFRRDPDGDGYRRREETHRLRLHRPGDVLTLLRRCGFTARTLAGGYAATGLPPGLTAFLARRI